MGNEILLLNAEGHSVPVGELTDRELARYLVDCEHDKEKKAPNFGKVYKGIHAALVSEAQRRGLSYRLTPNGTFIPGSEKSGSKLTTPPRYDKLRADAAARPKLRLIKGGA